MKKLLFATLLLLCNLMVNAQIKVTGTVYSEQNRETLIGATIIIEGTETGTEEGTETGTENEDAGQA